jgi:hypothetical protein
MTRATRALKDTVRVLVGMLIGACVGLAIGVPPGALVVAGYPGWAGIYLATLFLVVLYGLMYLALR